MRQAIRKELARRSTKAFASIYLANHFSLAWGEHHDDLFAAIDRLGLNKRIARAEPRKSGKTSIVSLALVLKKLAFREKQFIVLIGESGATADSNLSTITQELETNGLLMEDFPHLAPAIDQKGQFAKWTDRQLVFQGGATVVAKGMGARMRGMKRNQFRPDLAILDDPESPETADTFGKRRRHKQWFGGTFMGLGAADWDVYVIGNLIHKDCLIADLLMSKEWDSKVYRAENKPVAPTYRFPVGNTKQDGSALWPEGLSLEALDAYRRQPLIGSRNYAQEMMNDPSEDQDKPFLVGSFAYFDFTPAALSSYEMIATFIDPAGGQRPSEVKQGKADFAAIVTAAKKAGKVQILDVRLTRGLPDEQIDLLLDVYQDFRPTIVGAEDNMFKNLLKSNIEERGRARNLYVPVRAVHQTQNKITRVLSIQPPIEAKTIEFARHLVTTCPEYFEQFDEFPGSYDDGPDATEGAIRLLENPISWRPL